MRWWSRSRDWQHASRCSRCGKTCIGRTRHRSSFWGFRSIGCRACRCSAVITFRPEFTPPWRGHTHVTGLTLNRLSRRRCGTLVAGLTAGKALPDVVLEQIAAKSDGMPLFAEELTKVVLESGLLREEDDRYELEGPLLPLAIPATLQDSLMARLDRLTPAKEVAQVAAVIGREFSHELLAAIVPRVEELDEALHQLLAAELVFRRGVTPQVTYSFKHALVRDAAYASLLKSRRRQLHARIAEVLEENFSAVVEAEPDVLANHWAEAGAADKAAIYRLKAGQRALAHSATAEAVAQLTTRTGAARDVARRRRPSSRRARSADHARRGAVRSERLRGARDDARLCARARALRQARRGPSARAGAAGLVGLVQRAR